MNQMISLSRRAALPCAIFTIARALLASGAIKFDMANGPRIIGPDQPAEEQADMAAEKEQSQGPPPRRFGILGVT